LPDLDFDRLYLEKDYPDNEGLVPTYVNLARCHGAMGDLDEARMQVDKAMRITNLTGLASLRIITLRALAECFPPEDRQSPIEPLCEALELAEHTGRLIDIAGCSFSLAHLTGIGRLWERGVAVLCQMDATAWLCDESGGYSIERPPRLPSVT